VTYQPWATADVSSLFRKVVVGVWKDRLTTSESEILAEELKYRVGRLGTLAFMPAVAPAPIATLRIRDILSPSPVRVINQDVNWPAQRGSYIGTTSLDMLRDAGIGITMVGHSERRRFFGETDKDVSRKVAGCLENSITPILCVGDAETDLKARREVLSRQIRGSLSDDNGAHFDISKVIIAYEPVWAISTWRTDQPLPSGEEVAGMLDLVREITEQVTRQDLTKSLFLFGGSVNPKTAPEYFARPEVDGALVGGASLEIDSLASIFSAAATAWPRSEV
jgi:triosephosphate isomerase (TIM)